LRPRVEEIDARAQAIMVPMLEAGRVSVQDTRRQNLKYGKIDDAVGA